MGCKGFGEKGRGMVSGGRRVLEWGPGVKVLYFVLDSIKPVRFSPVQSV